MLQAVIFDFDGTIAQTSIRQYNWFKFYSEKNNKPWKFNRIDDFLVFYNELLHQSDGVQNVYDALDLPCDMNDKSHPVWPAYEKFNQDNPQLLYNGIKETIEEIWNIGSLTDNINRNRRLKLGINTTNSWKSIYNDLKKGNILQYFDAFVTEEILRKYHGDGNSNCITKPSTISLALSLGLLDTLGAHTIHVGDTLNDLKSSQKVIRLNPTMPETLITVGACYGYEGRSILEKGVETDKGIVKFDYLIDEPKDLIKIVRDLL